jgi:hypothetical protein
VQTLCPRRLREICDLICCLEVEFHSNCLQLPPTSTILHQPVNASSPESTWLANPHCDASQRRYHDQRARLAQPKSRGSPQAQHPDITPILLEQHPYRHPAGGIDLRYNHSANQRSDKQHHPPNREGRSLFKQRTHQTQMLSSSNLTTTSYPTTFHRHSWNTYLHARRWHHHIPRLLPHSS